MSSLNRLKHRASSTGEGMEHDALESDYLGPNSKVTGLINALANMAKNPSIDSELSEILDEFLEKLEEDEVYLAQGINNINFAEAALLLQSSTNLYSKKVDLLWDFIFEYQKQMVLNDPSSEKEKEIDKLEERKRKHKRKRKVNADANQASKLVSQFSWGATQSVDYLNQSYEVVDLSHEWQKFATYQTTDDNLKLQSSSQNLFLPNDTIHSEDNEYIGRYDQFHSASIISEIFHLEHQKLLPDQQGCVTRMRIDSHVINDFFCEKSIPSDQPQDCYMRELSEYINKFIESRNEPPRDQPCTSKISPELIRRCSAADSLFDEDRFSSISGHCTSLENSDPKNCDNNVELAIEEDPSCASIPEKRNKSCSQDSAFFDISPEDDIEDITELESVATKDVTPNISDKKNNNVTTDQLCCTSRVIVTRQKERKRWGDLLETDIAETDEETNKKRRIEPKKKRMSEKMLLKLMTGVTADFRAFENFCRQQYQPSDSEGEIPPCLTDSDSSSSESDDDDAMSDTDDLPPMTSGPEPIEDPEVDEQEPTEDPDSHHIDDLVNPVSLAIRDLNLRNCNFPAPPEPGPSTSAFCNSSLEASRKNVREWRSFILPKLKNMENKSDFDIHEYGSRILGSSEVGESRHFKDIVKGKGPSEVARYFIATLQLANSSNVEIGGVLPGEKANDSLLLTTKDKTRYHELLEDYQAPSEENFRERLEKVGLHSTPFGASPSKKSKMDHRVSRKKLF